jgi:hypothetical protein
MKRDEKPYKLFMFTILSHPLLSFLPPFTILNQHLGNVEKVNKKTIFSHPLLSIPPIKRQETHKIPALVKRKTH